MDYLRVPVVPEILRAKVGTFAELCRKTRQLEQLNRELEQRVAGEDRGTGSLDRTAARERAAPEPGAGRRRHGVMGPRPPDGSPAVGRGQHYIFGVDPAGFTATPETILALVHPEDREPLQHATARAVETGQAYEAEFRIIRPDGQVRWCIEWGAPTLDAAGRVVRVKAASLDITERKDIADRQAIMAVKWIIGRRTSWPSCRRSCALPCGDDQGVHRCHGWPYQRYRGRTACCPRRTGRLSTLAAWSMRLTPYQASKTERIAIAGPTVLLQAATAQSLALAMHELATNAAKHGALSGTAEIASR